MSYSYQIVESPLPVSGYESTLAVMDSGGGSMITWSGDFAAKGAPDDQALEVISGIYEAGLNRLRTACNRRRRRGRRDGPAGLRVSARASSRRSATVRKAPTTR